MIFDEAVHTDVVIAFYRAIEQLLPDTAAQVFRKCVQQYGEERGRRMAMRAMQMGYSLSFNAYQACGEWASTRPELSDSRAAEPISGASHTRNYHCLWCQRFRERDAVDVARAYCAEIDRSLVRGFNPDMPFELRGTAHDGDCCEFVFGGYDPGMKLERPANGVRDFEFHCAHTYHSFCFTLMQYTKPYWELRELADTILEGWYGEEFAAAMKKYDYMDFIGIC